MHTPQAPNNDHEVFLSFCAALDAGMFPIAIFSGTGQSMEADNAPTPTSEPVAQECEPSEYERYEEYIAQIASNYADAVSDGWGGIEAQEIARKLHPFDEWKGW